MIKYVMVLFVFLVYFNSYSQRKIRFQSQNYIGLLEGETGSAFQVQTINGVAFGSWSSGIGAGLDFYRYRTIPVFLSVNKYLRADKRSLFFSADGGLNFTWLKEVPPGFGNNIVDRKYTPSLYMSGGFGYRIPLGNKKEAFLMNVGYSYKRFKEERQYVNFCQNPPCAFNTERFDYRLKRLSLRLGLEF